MINISVLYSACYRCSLPGSTARRVELFPHQGSMTKPSSAWLFRWQRHPYFTNFANTSYIHTVCTVL